MGTPARLKLSAQESLLRRVHQWSKIDFSGLQRQSK